jgi:hypothetical protein
MAYDVRKRMIAIVAEATYNTDPIGSWPPFFYGLDQGERPRHQHRDGDRRG